MEYVEGRYEGDTLNSRCVADMLKGRYEGGYVEGSTRAYSTSLHCAPTIVVSLFTAFAFYHIVGAQCNEVE